MSGETSKGNPAPAITNKPKRTALIVAIIAIVAVVVVILLVIIATTQGQSSSSIQVNSWSIEQSYSGPTTFTVTVENTGSVQGSGTIYCEVTVPAPASGGMVQDYHSTKLVTLSPGDGAQTYTITVDTPFGTTVTNNMCSVTMQRA
jgi:hypothetical protein